MLGGATSSYIKAINQELVTAFGDQLLALYLYGSLSNGTYQVGQSDINLLLVLDETVSIHDIRTGLRPFWLQYGSLLKRVPFTATPSSLHRHLIFNPELAKHLVDQSVLLHGMNFLPEYLVDDSLNQLSRIAHLTMRASAALTPSLLPEIELKEALNKLRSLTRQVFGKAVDENETAAHLLADLQCYVFKQLKIHEHLLWADRQVADAPPLVSDLRSIYETDNTLILLLPETDEHYLSDRINEIDWPAVGTRVAGHYRGLWLTTASIFRLILSHDAAADFFLNNYQYAWGLNPLADLQVDRWRIYRDLGRLPSHMVLSGIMEAYIQSEDADLAMLVHDLQNNLLNIQLRNELLSRIEKIPVSAPEKLLPDRTAPVTVRLEGILDHCNWWADYYANKLLAAREITGSDNQG